MQSIIYMLNPINSTYFFFVLLPPCIFALFNTCLRKFLREISIIFVSSVFLTSYYLFLQ